MLDSFDPLSEQGRRRREQILQEARDWARGRRLRRRMVRGGIGGLVVLLLIGLALFFRERGKTQPDSIEVLRTPVPSLNHSTGIVVTRIVTEHGLADRLAIKAQGASVPRLTDQQLLERLAEGGRPAAVAYVDGREIVLTGAPLRIER